MIEIKDIITLDDNNKYVVVSKISYKNKYYYYLIDMDNTDSIFCYEDKDELVELNDELLIGRLLPLFYRAAKEEID